MAARTGLLSLHADEILPAHLASQPELIGVGCIRCIKEVAHTDANGNPDRLDNLAICNTSPLRKCQACRTGRVTCSPPPARWRRAFNVVEYLLQDYKRGPDGATADQATRARAVNLYAQALVSKWNSYIRLRRATRDELEGYHQTDEFNRNWERYNKTNSVKYGGLGQCYPMNEVVDKEVEDNMLAGMRPGLIRIYWLGTS